jgi:hypothetical protein
VRLLAEARKALHDERQLLGLNVPPIAPEPAKTIVEVRSYRPRMTKAQAARWDAAERGDPNWHDAQPPPGEDGDDFEDEDES